MNENASGWREIKPQSFPPCSCWAVCVSVCVWERTVEHSDSWKWFTFQTPQLPLPTPKHTLTHISQRRLYRNYMWAVKHELLAHWERNNLYASEPAHSVCYCACLSVHIFLHQPKWINALAYYLFKPIFLFGVNAFNPEKEKSHLIHFAAG